MPGNIIPICNLFNSKSLRFDIFFLTKKYYVFGLTSYPLTYFINMTVLNVCVGLSLVQFFQTTSILLTLIPQTTEFWNSWFLGQRLFLKKNNKVYINYILLIFKLYDVYEFREKKIIFVNNLKAKIQNDKRIEEEIVLVNSKKIILLTKNWYLTNNIISVM